MENSEELKKVGEKLEEEDRETLRKMLEEAEEVVKFNTETLKRARIVAMVLKGQSEINFSGIKKEAK